MTKAYTLQRAVKEAKLEADLCPSKMGMRQVAGGPSVNAYRDMTGRLRLDIIGAGLMFPEITYSQALRLAEVLFI